MLDDPDIEVEQKSEMDHFPSWGGVWVMFDKDIVEERSWKNDDFEGSSTSSIIGLPLWTKAPNGILAKEVEETFDKISAFCGVD